MAGVLLLKEYLGVMKNAAILNLFLLGNTLVAQSFGPISLNPAKTVKVVAVDLKDKFLDVEIRAKIKNISADSVSLRWNRRQPNLPSGWISQVCDGITCFEEFVSSNLDSTLRINVPVKLKAGEEREFILHVFPVTKAGKANIFLDLFSMRKPDSLLATMEFDVTINNLSTLSRVLAAAPAIRIFPNPACEYIFLEDPVGNLGDIQVVRLSGQVMRSLPMAPDGRYDISFLPSGPYLMRWRNGEGNVRTRLFFRAID